MKKALINSVKVAVSVGLLAVLAYKGWASLRQDPEAYEQLVRDQKDWRLLGAALVVTLAGVLLTFVRWFVLVRALGLPFRLREAVRLGFVGFLFNFTLSIVGGDVIKAVAIAHRQPGRRAAAAATVVVDRLVGLYALFVVATVASFFMPLEILPPDQVATVQGLCRTIQIMTLAGGVGFAVVLLPGLTTLSIWEALGRIPKVGGTITGVMDSIRMYRRQPGMLATVLGMGLVTHCLYAAAIFLLSRGFPGEDPTLAANFIVAPISMVAKAAPLPGGLGAFEGAFAFMYLALSPAGVYPVQGLVIAVAFRVLEIVIAFIGALYYFADRREVQALMAEAEQEEPAAAS